MKDKQSFSNPSPSFIENDKNGFHLYQLEKGIIYQGTSQDKHQLIFLLEGEAKISTGSYRNHFYKNDFCLLPATQKVSIDSLTETILLQFVFDMQSFQIHSCLFMQKAKDEKKKHNFCFKPLQITETLLLFLSLQKHYISKQLSSKSLEILKQQELLFILQQSYTRKELYHFFYPLQSYTLDFKEVVLQNYKNAKTINELAEMMGYNIRMFQRKFQQYFSTSPYQWLQNQKAKQIYYRIMEGKEKLSDLTKEYEFSSPAHFNKFCKLHFNMTPSEMRKKRTKEE